MAISLKRAALPDLNQKEAWAAVALRRCPAMEDVCA
jgi:hypothetical protein